MIHHLEEELKKKKIASPPRNSSIYLILHTACRPALIECVALAQTSELGRQEYSTVFTV